MKKQEERIEDFTVERIQQMVAQNEERTEARVSFSPDLTVVLGGRPSTSVGSMLRAAVPYRIEQARLGFIVQGRANVCLNLQDYCLEAGMALFAADGSILQINSYSPDTELIAMAVSEEMLSSIFGMHKPQLLRQGRAGCYFPLSPHAQDVALRCFRLLYDLAQQGTPMRPAATGIVASLFHLYDALYAQHVAQAANEDMLAARPKHVFDRFLRLVTQHCTHEREIAFYAQQLCLSPRYLGTLVLQASGSTAKWWIDRAVITEAKVQLRHTTLSAEQIADALHFPSPSLFSKYFKRLTGLTPWQYRKSL